MWIWPIFPWGRSGARIGDVQDAWAVGMGTTVDPSIEPSTAQDVRGAYASARDSD